MPGVLPVLQRALWPLTLTWAAWLPIVPGPWAGVRRRCEGGKVRGCCGCAEPGRERLPPACPLGGLGRAWGMGLAAQLAGQCGTPPRR